MACVTVTDTGLSQWIAIKAGFGTSVNTMLTKLLLNLLITFAFIDHGFVYKITCFLGVCLV